MRSLSCEKSKRSHATAHAGIVQKDPRKGGPSGIHFLKGGGVLTRAETYLLAILGTSIQQMVKTMVFLGDLIITRPLNFRVPLSGDNFDKAPLSVLNQCHVNTDERKP